jgi:hypothetical protein
MKQFIGTKTLLANPMTLGDYNIHRGWTIPEDEDPNKEGYIVQYADNYVSWSPKEAFEESYRSDGQFDFGHAMFLLKQGARVSRSGWNGKNMFIFLVQGSTFTVNREPLISILGEGTEVSYHGHVDMRTADGTIVPWLCSQTDMLANDWGVVPDA